MRVYFKNSLFPNFYMLIYQTQANVSGLGQLYSKSKLLVRPDLLSKLLSENCGRSYCCNTTLLYHHFLAEIHFFFTCSNWFFALLLMRFTTCPKQLPSTISSPLKHRCICRISQSRRHKINIFSTMYSALLFDILSSI